MPKVITYSDHPAFLQTSDGNEYPEGSPEASLAEKREGTWKRRGIHVGWIKGRSVEIGAASFDASRENPSDGVFMSLDRNGINRLIRALRDARDSAYGKDA